MLLASAVWRREGGSAARARTGVLSCAGERGEGGRDCGSLFSMQVYVLGGWYSGVLYYLYRIDTLRCGYEGFFSISPHSLSAAVSDKAV